MAIYLGAGSFPVYSSANITAGEYVGNLTGQSSSGLYGNIIANFILPALLTAAAVSLATKWITGDNSFAILGAFAAFFVNFLLVPISTINSMGLPSPLNFVVLGIMNMLLLITIISFVRG
jgi:hypothetical protein